MNEGRGQGKERRKHPRIKKKLRLVVHKKYFFFLWAGRNVGELVDISNGGAQINTKRVLEQGDRVVMSLQPRHFSPSVHFHGKVVWAKTRYHENIKYRQAGIQFRRIGRYQRRMLARLAKGAEAA
ncbi:MAG TPA: PilZ domain-containing protein [Chitinivibrionales bacterium]|nr:PilZ domain-containing protein [Chitinivibrionales bacterium]